MARYNKTNNVKKVCGCADYRSCEHSWFLAFCRNGRRYRGSLELMVGRRISTFEEASEAAKEIISSLTFPKSPPRSKPDGHVAVTIKLKRSVFTQVTKAACRRFKRQSGRILSEALLFGLKRRFGVEVG